MVSTSPPLPYPRVGNRLVKVQNANTAAPPVIPNSSVCLDKEDLCVAKLCAFRPKDQKFVQALIQEHLVDPVVITDRLGTVDARYTADHFGERTFRGA